MDLPQLQKIVINALEDIKGRDIQVIDTTELSPLFDRIVIASGDSNRQVRALARNVHDEVREAGGEVISVEGEENGEWVLVDLGDIVVHVMQPAVRSFYALEELWGTPPTRRAGSETAAGSGRRASAPPPPAA
jgi:ribosome-associated protein